MAKGKFMLTDKAPDQANVTIKAPNMHTGELKAVWAAIDKTLPKLRKEAA